MVDDQVGSEALFEHQPIVLEANCRLSLYMKPPLLEKMGQNRFID